MLKAACRRYHRLLDRGVSDSHWRECAVCASYTRALLIARRAGVRPILPHRLRRDLRGVGGGAGSERPSPPRPLLPLPLPALPADLELRLRRIPATAAASAPPAILRSAWPAVAASYLLMVALGLLLGNPYRIGAEAVRYLTATTADAWSTVERRGDGLWSSVESTSTWARSEADLQRRDLLQAGEELLARARQLPASLDLPLLSAGEENGAAASPSPAGQSPNDREPSSLRKESTP